MNNNIRASLSKGEANTGSSYDIEQDEIMIWCNNKKWNTLHVFMVDDGRCVSLVLNHRANALAEAGRFDTKNFNDIGTLRNHNQDLKDSYGTNYFFGDIVFNVPRGEPTPNPQAFLATT